MKLTWERYDNMECCIRIFLPTKLPTPSLVYEWLWHVDGNKDCRFIACMVDNVWQEPIVGQWHSRRSIFGEVFKFQVLATRVVTQGRDMIGYQRFAGLCCLQIWISRKRRNPEDHDLKLHLREMSNFVLFYTCCKFEIRLYCARSVTQAIYLFVT